MAEKRENRFEQLRRGGNYAVIKNVMRRPVEGAFPPLMDDVRENYLVYDWAENVTTYLKAVAGPYTGEHGVHFLVIPDAHNGTDLSGVKDLSPQDLRATLQMAEAVAYETFQQEGITEVDFGWHHSRAELTGIPKQRAATFPKNLHVHVTGYAEKDMRPLSVDEVIKNRDLKGKTGDVLHFISEELFSHEIVSELQQDPNSYFNELFEPIRDQRGRLRFRMRGGRENFANPNLPLILQTIDRRAKEVYDEVAKCFFEYDADHGRFAEKNDKYARFKLLPIERRREEMISYLTKRPWLSNAARTGLRFLVENAKDETEILNRELARSIGGEAGHLTDSRSDTEMKQAANRFWAYKNLVYTMVWSAKKGENSEVEWIFGFDPMIFTVEGIPQSSSFTDKIILKNNVAFTPAQLTALQEREEKIFGGLLDKDPRYQRGKSATEV